MKKGTSNTSSREWATAVHPYFPDKDFWLSYQNLYWTKSLLNFLGISIFVSFLAHSTSMESSELLCTGDTQMYALEPALLPFLGRPTENSFIENCPEQIKYIG